MTGSGNTVTNKDAAKGKMLETIFQIANPS